MSEERAVAVWLPPDACRRLTDRAAAAGCTVSELVRRLSDTVPGQPDVIASALLDGQPAIVWSDGPMGGVWPAPPDP